MHQNYEDLSINEPFNEFVVSERQHHSLDLNPEYTVFREYIDSHLSKQGKLL